MKEKIENAYFLGLAHYSNSIDMLIDDCLEKGIAPDKIIDLISHKNDQVFTASMNILEMD